MLNTITWQGYWTTLALLTAGYYLAIYLLYFKQEFQKQRQSSATSPAGSLEVDSDHPPEEEASSFFDEEDAFQTPPEGDEQAAYACMDEINAYLEEAKKTKCVKSELLYALQRILFKNNALKDSPHKESITKVIVSEAAHQCSLHLSEDDMVKVWAGS